MVFQLGSVFRPILPHPHPLDLAVFSKLLKQVWAAWCRMTFRDLLWQPWFFLIRETQSEGNNIWFSHPSVFNDFLLKLSTDLLRLPIIKVSPGLKPWVSSNAADLGLGPSDGFIDTELAILLWHVQYQHIKWYKLIITHITAYDKHKI